MFIHFLVSEKLNVDSQEIKRKSLNSLDVSKLVAALPQSPVHLIERPQFDLELQPCDAKELLSGEPPAVRTVLEGVDVQRGHGVVKADDGRRAELATVAVDAWHIREHGEEELPPASLGQLHQGDTYIIRWTYSITTLGEPLGGVGAGRKFNIVCQAAVTSGASVDS